MENEEQKKETNKQEANENISIVDEARSIRDEIVRAKEDLKAENERKEKIQANEMLGSSAGGHIEAEPPKEETAKEYAERVMKGDLK